jgi:ABC-type nitrate/sulfonate/bicarbonate transport system permease component
MGVGGSRLRRVADDVGAAAVGLGVLLAFFEVAPRVGVLPESSFPPTSEVAVTLWGMLRTAEPWRAAGQTLGAWARAMGFATLVGVPLGLAMGASRTVAQMFRLTVEFLRPIPSVALIPALVLVYGTHSSLTVALGAYAAAFPLLFQAMYGVADIDPVATDMSRVLGMSWYVRLRHIVVPSCAPYLATGLRISASVALILVITGEYVVGVSGLGQKVLIAQNGGAYDRAYAWVLVAGVLGLLVNLAFRAAERHFLRWHPAQRHEPAAAL